MKGKQSILLSQIEQFSQMVLVGTNQYVLLLIQYIQINLKKKSFSGQDLIKFLEMIIPCCWCTCPVYSSTHELCVHFQTPQILLFPTCPPGALSLSQQLPLTRFCCTQHTCVSCPQSPNQYKLPINCD